MNCKGRLIVASLLEALLAAPRGGTRRHLEEGRERGELLRAASANSSVAAVSAPSQQLKQATAVSRDDERSMGTIRLKLFQHSLDA